MLAFFELLLLSLAKDFVDLWAKKIKNKNKKNAFLSIVLSPVVLLVLFL